MMMVQPALFLEIILSNASWQQQTTAKFERTTLCHTHTKELMRRAA